jgi:hypothetical protein
VTNDLIYEERLSSSRTEALFVALTLLFAALFTWRASAHDMDALAVVFGCSGLFFLFYALNYRTLKIRLTSQVLRLQFGLFAWTAPVDNIESCQLDDVPLLLRFGGAGIHFMSVRGRYRASFNLLEYPRVVIMLRRKAGPVRDISFSTRHPDDVIRLVQRAVSVRGVS